MSRHYDMYCREFEERQKANSCIDRLQSSIEQLQTELDTANKNYKNARLGAENSIYNLLSHITNNKYGPWSVSRKDDIVPQWFDALEKEVKQLQAENKRLREGLEEIEAVACGEEQIEADGDYDDGDGMKWIYDRTQALKEVKP